MTRRITIAIILIVWAMVIASCVTAYFATRVVLLQELDARLIARAAALPDVGGGDGKVVDPRDRYLVRTQHGQILHRAETAPATVRPILRSAGFARLADGLDYRSVTVDFERPGTQPLTIVYSTPADSFDRVLQRLAVALGCFGLVGSITAALIAAAAARAALGPLANVASLVGTVDERNLSRRVDVERLPTELHEVARRLNAMLDRIEEHVVQRRRFLADASHELRTPVAALMTTLQVNLARRSVDVEQQRAVLEDCLTDARILRGLVERLTDQVRGEIEPEPAAFDEVDLTSLLDECVTVARGLALSRNIKVDADIPRGLLARTQTQRVRRAVLNLISNAVDYNVDAGRIELRCGVHETDVAISVKDTGIGIAADHLPHIFSPFYRADMAREATAQHFGLGLAQVRSDVAFLKGTYDVQSTVGAGTEIVIHLPDCSFTPVDTEPSARLIAGLS